MTRREAGIAQANVSLVCFVRSWRTTRTFSDRTKNTIGDDGLATVVSELQPYRFLSDEETDEVYDLIGTAFDVHLASHLKGNRCQY